MTSSRSQAGNLQYEDDLMADISNSTKCGVDALLKYFLSLVLEEDDPKKRRLNELQTEIEKLQLQRYYNLDGNGDTATRTDGTGIAEAEPAGTQRAATGGLQDSGEKNVDPDDDTQFGSAEEMLLVKGRDGILNALLHDVLEAVLPDANNQRVKDRSNAFAQQFAAQEAARCGPYDLLCNNVLDRLAKLETDEQGQPLAAPRSTVSLNLPQDLDGFWTNDGQAKILAEVNVDTDVFLSHQSHSLAGRATLVFPADGVAQDGTPVSTPMVCKIYHPELQRRHEGQTPQIVHKIAKKEDEGMVKHLPSMYFYGDVPGCTTQRIRSMVSWNRKGHRTLRILGLKKLDKITSLEGADFIKAWLETLICHSFLWKNHVKHGDPSLSNIMYDPDKKCGVLSDFDLSLLQWEPRVVGTYKTGTVPFMAIDLLTKGYWEGTTQRFYHHEMESFIWILAYVVLYDKGARKASPEVEAWRTSNYATCYKEKLAFYTETTLTEVVKDHVQPSYRNYWPLVETLCSELNFAHAQRCRLRLNSTQSRTDLPSIASEALWNVFTNALESKLLVEDLPNLPELLKRLQLHKPSFSIPDAGHTEGPPTKISH